MTQSDTGAQDPVDGYLAAVATRLAGPARARKAILAELHDGLLEAIDAHLTRGSAPVQAAIAAIDEFGDPRTVSSAFAPELAANHARRVALTLAPTGPLVGLLWIGAYAASDYGPTQAAPPWRWPGLPTGASLAFSLLGVLIAIAGLSTLLVIASTGRPGRWLPTPPSLAPTAAATLGIAAITVDLTILGLLAFQATTAAASLAPAPVTLAATASLTRLVLAARATRRCQTARAAFT